MIVLPPRASWSQNVLTRLPFGFLCLVFILFPVAQLSVFGLPVYWSETMLFAALTTTSLTGWVWLKKRYFEVSLEWWSLYMAGALFLVGISIAFVLNPHSLSDWGEMKSFYFIPVAFLISILFFGETTGKLETLTLAWLFGIAAASIAAFMAAVMGWWLYDGRLAGPYSSSNYLAMLVAPGILFALYFLQSRVNRSVRLLSALSLVLMLFVLWLTRSYAAWVSLSIAVVVFVSIGKFTLRAALVSLIILAIAAGIFLVRESGSEKWQAIISGNERSSLASRVMIWRSAAQIAWDSFPWGIGIGRFQGMYLEYQRYFPPYLEWAVPTPHNIYLHFLIEGGLLTLCGWLGCIAIIATAAWKSWFRVRSKREGLFTAMSVALLSFYLVYGLVDTPYMKNDLVLAIWGSLGLLAGSVSSRTLERDTVQLA